MTESVVRMAQPLVGNAAKLTESGAVRIVTRLAGPPGAATLEFDAFPMGV